MLRLETNGKFSYVLRNNNEKIVLFYGGDPTAVIVGRVLFQKYNPTIPTLAPEVRKTMQEFASNYKWAYDTTIENRVLVDNITIGV
jgi:hypothetical protein